MINGIYAMPFKETTVSSVAHSASQKRVNVSYHTGGMKEVNLKSECLQDDKSEQQVHYGRFKHKTENFAECCTASLQMLWTLTPKL